MKCFLCVQADVRPTPDALTFVAGTAICGGHRDEFTEAFVKTIVDAAAPALLQLLDITGFQK